MLCHKYFAFFLASLALTDSGEIFMLMEGLGISLHLERMGSSVDCWVLVDGGGVGCYIGCTEHVCTHGIVLVSLGVPVAVPNRPRIFS